MEIIAEIGQNHNGDLELAKRLIHAARENGADVAKFQLYEAEKLFPKEGNQWYAYNCQTEISRKQLGVLVEECRKADIEFMASVFDVERLGWLEELGVHRHKIASRSINDRQLLDAIGKTGKPMLVSLGMWEGNGLPVINSVGPVQFLYCIAKYPAELTELHLAEVDFTGSYAGFSDHSLGITASLVAFARGAKIVEKHFTLDKAMYGPDHVCSMTPDELHRLSTLRKEIGQCL